MKKRQKSPSCKTPRGLNSKRARYINTALSFHPLQIPPRYHLLAGGGGLLRVADKAEGGCVIGDGVVLKGRHAAGELLYLGGLVAGGLLSHKAESDVRDGQGGGEDIQHAHAVMSAGGVVNRFC